MGSNFQELHDSADGDLEFAQELLCMFEEQIREETERLVEAGHRSDRELAAHIAHKLVGSSLACGFEELGQQFRLLEWDCLRAWPDQFEERMDRLMRLFEDGLKLMRSYLVAAAT